MEHASHSVTRNFRRNEESEWNKHLMAGHLSAAYNLARWLLRNHADAEDAVQDAYVRAFKHFDTYRGGEGKAWLLRIVRNSCYDRLRVSTAGKHVEYDEETPIIDERALNPESSLLRREYQERVRQAVGALPDHAREILTFHAFEQMTYAQIAATIGIPIGTVMSRLSRAREQLRQGFLTAGIRPEERS